MATRKATQSQSYALIGAEQRIIGFLNPSQFLSDKGIATLTDPKQLGQALLDGRVKIERYKKSADKVDDVF